MAWSLWAVCHFTVTHALTDWTLKDRASNSTQNTGDVFGGLAWVWELPLSSVPHWWIIHASHHTSHTPAYVMSATRGEAYACTCVWVDVFIFRLGLRERWLILFALSFYPTICPPTHHLFLRGRKYRNRSISLDLSQLYYVVITSLHLFLCESWDIFSSYSVKNKFNKENLSQILPYKQCSFPLNIAYINLIIYFFHHRLPPKIT